MFRSQLCNTWQDIRDLDEAGTFRNECMTLLDQIINFTYSETPIDEQASRTDVEKQNLRYRLLEEDNLVLKEQVLSLQRTIELKVEEINELKLTISQLKNNKQGEISFEEVSLPDVKNTIKRINSSIEDMLGTNSTDGTEPKNTVLNSEISHSAGDDDVSNISSTNVSLSIDDPTVCLDGDADSMLATISSRTTCFQVSGSKSNLFDKAETFKEGSLLKLEDNYYSLQIENLTLQDKVKTLVDRVMLLKTSLKSCELELIQYDKILSLIKQERFNLINELRETKHCYNALKLRNEYLEEKLVELENRLKLESSLEPNQREENDDCAQIEVLNCYKNRLYEAFKEMTMKEEQIGQLNDSINGLVEKFKLEKSSLEMEHADYLKKSKDKLKLLDEEKVKLEETIRQQSKLIDHLQAMVECREKKHNTKINCMKDN